MKQNRNVGTGVNRFEAHKKRDKKIEGLTYVWRTRLLTNELNRVPGGVEYILRYGNKKDTVLYRNCITEEEVSQAGEKTGYTDIWVTQEEDRRLSNRRAVSIESSLS